MNGGRELFSNIVGARWVYALGALAAAAAGYGFHRRYALWRRGRPACRNDRKWIRMTSAFRIVFGQSRILRKRGVGLMHFSVFWGMMALFAGTVIVAFQADFGLTVLRGTFYRYFKLCLDLAGVALGTGLLVAAGRLIVGGREASAGRLADGAVLLLGVGVVATGFILEGLRIASTRDPLGSWSPAGFVMAGALAGTEQFRLAAAHRVAWWTHAALCLGFLGFIPYSRLIHIVTAPLNVYFRSLDPKGCLPPVDLSREDAGMFGATSVEDLTWKDLLDVDACVRCGRCEEHCPAHAAEKPLSPETIIRKLGVHLAETRRECRSRELLGSVVDEEALWACTTCRSCTEQCPVYVEHLPKIVEMRRGQVMMHSRFPPELIAVFRNLEDNGNPWGLGRSKREEWAEGLDIGTVGNRGTPEYLYWVGCAASFDDRNRRVAAAMARILGVAGVDFAILGNEERCCGDFARRLGNEYLYERLARENVKTLTARGIRKLITHCPHCLNALKNEYPRFGGEFEVIHHTEFIARLFASSRLAVAGKPGGSVTYQDPCYLGRYNGVYLPPREIIDALGLQLAEMPRSRRESSCCGAGGGRMWLDDRIGRRINVMRAEESLSTGARCVATACPYCLTMMEDGIKLKDQGDRVRTADVAELVLDAVQGRPGLTEPA